MKNKEIKKWAKMKNRHGLTSFIKDEAKIQKLYEEAHNSDSIDVFDHWMIATVIELGFRKELEIKRLQKELDKTVKISMLIMI